VTDPRIIEWVNQQRQRRNLEPLTALPDPEFTAGHVRSPIELALDSRVVLGRLMRHEGVYTIFLTLPDLITRYISDYRDGRFHQPKENHQ